MKKHIKKLAVYLMSGCLLASTYTVVPSNPLTMEAEAHPGRTDSNGGHRDNKNKSGLGSYHYHCGGYPAHLHTNGVCPYQSGTGTNSNSTEKSAETQSQTPKQEAETQAVTAGWQQDSTGWWYRTADNQFYKNGWQEIDSKWYYFDANGYMKTGWLSLDSNYYYLAADGHMMTGEVDIDGTYYYFDRSGKLNDTYYDDDYGYDNDEYDYDEYD